MVMKVREFSLEDEANMKRQFIASKVFQIKLDQLVVKIKQQRAQEQLEAQDKRLAAVTNMF